MELPSVHPDLQSVDSHGKVRIWKIWVDDATIVRQYGMLGGKEITNRKEIKVAKSQNSPQAQARFEADQMWKEMVQKKGYGMKSHPIIAPTPPQIPGDLGNSPPGDLGELRSPIKFLPMLANKFLERKGYVKYPCLAQPKLDGVRYSARIHEGHVLLRTRSDGECPFFHEIKSAVAQLHLDPNVILDGEFYSTAIPFKTLNGYCNRKKLDGKSGFNTIPPEHLASIHYNIFDCYFINEPLKPFVDRYAYLVSLLGNMEGRVPQLNLVHCVEIPDEKQIYEFHHQFVEQGYEGIIIRNRDAPYKIKDRSNDLLKYKQFSDTEFTIVGASTPDNGKEEGCIIWHLALAASGPDTPLTFTCRPRDTYQSRKEDWITFQSNPSAFLGQSYTVRYQECYPNGIPRFPVGIALRHDLSPS